MREQVADLDELIGLAQEALDRDMAHVSFPVAEWIKSTHPDFAQRFNSFITNEERAKFLAMLVAGEAVDRHRQLVKRTFTSIHDALLK